MILNISIKGIVINYMAARLRGFTAVDLLIAYQRALRLRLQRQLVDDRGALHHQDADGALQGNEALASEIVIAANPRHY